jgi:phosphoenolpyruvate carboxykinase (GTP)
MEIAPDTSAINVPAHLRHARLRAWVTEIATLTQPDRVYWADGTQAEYEHVCEAMALAGTLTRLNPAKRPNSYLAWSDPTDVARRGMNVHLQQDARRRRPDK